MKKTKTVLLSTILFALGAMLVCFGALSMPTKQAQAYAAGSSATLSAEWKNGLSYNITNLTITNKNFDTNQTFVQTLDVSDSTSQNTLTAYVTGDTTNGYDCTIYADVEKIYAPSQFLLFSGWDAQVPTVPNKLIHLKSITFDDCWDTSNVTNMNGMFLGCSELTTISGFEYWDTSSVKYFAVMFAGCESLTELNLNNFDTKNAKSDSFCLEMAFANFYTESGNTSLYAIADFMAMEYNKDELTYCDVANYVLEYFYGQEPTMTDEDEAKSYLKQNLLIFSDDIEIAPIAPMALNSINLSNWTISAETGTSNMFGGCTNLTTLVAPATCEKAIALPVTLYDANGNEFASISAATNGKTLTNTLPSAGFDGLELVATTSVGVIALLAVGYAIISTKKRKETKFDV